MDNAKCIPFTTFQGGNIAPFYMLANNKTISGKL
jgi:hypothetical protein